MAYRGELLAARDHLEQAIPLTDSLHGPFWVVTARGHAAMVLWALGDRDGATRLTLDNLRFAEQLTHPMGVTLSIYWAALIEVLRGDAAMTRQRSEEAIAIGSLRGFKNLAASCRVLRGWALAELGEPEAGIAEITESIETQRAMGFRMGIDFFLALLAQARCRAGQIKEALEAVDEALAEEEAVGAHLWQAELLRLKGELLWALSPDRTDEAESTLRRAIAIATDQQAESMRQRAEASLLRLFET